jgi:hypothetical protein
MGFDPTSAWMTAKALAGIAKDAGKLELYAQALDLQAQLSDMLEENRNKTARIHDLEEQLRIKDSVTFRRNTYWMGGTDEPADGPYCPTCYGDEGKLIHLTATESNPAWRHCGKCKKSIEVFPERRPPYQSPPPKRGTPWAQEY